MRLFLLLAVILFLGGCGTLPPVAESPLSGRLRNACLPEAALMSESLQRGNIKAKVLIINTTTWSHAICVYMYPTGANTLWGYDTNWKSCRLRAWWGDPMGQANAWVARNGKNEVVTGTEEM